MFKWLKRAAEKREKKARERRNHPRLNSLIDVVYKMPDKSGPGVISLAKDVSASGMKLLTQKNLKLDTLLDIKIDLPKQEGLVSALGKVVWYKRRGGIGIKFLMIRPKDEDRHMEFIDKNLKEQKDKVQA